MTDWTEYRRKPAVREARRLQEPTTVETSHGEVEAEAGDYLVRDPHGDVYPVSGEKFRELYAPADEGVPLPDHEDACLQAARDDLAQLLHEGEQLPPESRDDLRRSVRRNIRTVLEGSQ